MLRKRVVPIVLTLVLAVALSGCIKLRLAARVQPDGSLTAQFAMGMTGQARTLITTSGQNDPFEDINETLLQDIPGVENVKVENWEEGDYQFKGVSGSVSNLSNFELNLQDQDVIRAVTYRNTPGTDVDRYEFRATIDPEALWAELEAETDTSSSPVKLRSVLTMEFVASLPGDIVETNGKQLNDPDNTVVWELAGSKQIELYLISEAPHDPNSTPVEIHSESNAARPAGPAGSTPTPTASG